MFRTLLLCAAIPLLAACAKPEAGLVGPLEGVDRVVVSEAIVTTNWTARKTVQITDPQKVAAVVDFVARHDRDWMPTRTPVRGDVRIALYAGNSLRGEVVASDIYLFTGGGDALRSRFVAPTAMQQVRALWQG